MLHLGKNPKKGGRPPKDKKLRNKINFNSLEWLNIEYIWFIKNNL